MAIILSSPKTFMGAAVIDFNASAGWNSETSTCSVNLVNDPETSGAENFNPANPGTAYMFTIGDLEFGGLLQQWTENSGVGSGKTFSVSLNSPTAALEGSQVIMNSYQGLIPIHNVFNPFGARENYTYGGIFGAAFTNSAGYPWGVLLQDIQNLVNTNYASGVFGGPYIRLGETLFKIDLTELAQLASGLYWYRVSGTHTTILSVIRDICEASSADFLVNMVGGDPDPVTGICTTPPTIQIRVMPRHSPPSLGILSAYVDKAEEDGILVSKEIGLEFGDTVTAKLVFGGPQSRMWENYSSEFGGLTIGGITIPGVQIRPIWDIDQERVTLGDHYNVDGNVSVRLSDGMTIGGDPFYRCTILELRCAMDSKETWETYASLYNPDIHNLFQQGDNLEAAAATVNVIVGNNTLKNKMQNKAATSFDVANTSASAAKQWAIKGEKTIQDTLDKIYNSIRRTADSYYGKKFFVAVPFEPGGFSNNVKFLAEDMDTVTAWEISNSAWVEPKPIADIAFYDGDGKLKPYAFYPYSSVYDYSNIGENYTTVGTTVFVGPNPIGGKIAVRDINVEPLIYWGFFKEGGLPYAICTVPKVTKEDKFSVKGGLESLYANAPASYITGTGPHSTGFGSDVTNINIAPAAIIPTAVGVAQESTRHVYGPWWHQGGLGGKAEVEHDASLKPETFGSTALMNAAGVTKAFATTLNVQNSESGEIELAELPTIGLGGRIAGDGPYLSQISISMSTSQVTTKYRFETWTLDFGKIAKYNSDRISRINKNTMRFLQEMRAKSKNPPLRTPQVDGGGVNSKAGMGSKQNRYAPRTNHMIVADTVKDGKRTVNNVGAQPVGTTMSQINKDYPKKFAMSQDGLFRPFVTRRMDVPGETAATDVPMMPHYTEVLSDGATGKFYRSRIYPTASDLNPLFAGAGKHDFQAITKDQSANDLNIRKDGFATSEYRGLGLRGPIIVTGWGYDVDRNPIPSNADGLLVNLGDMGNGKAKFETFLTDHMRQSQEWKTGPLEMYWDEKRDVWATRWEMVECRLIESLNAPKGLQHPTSGVANIIGSDGLDTGESFYLVNRDPALSVNIDASTHSDHAYCIAIYIGKEWRPLYITCETAPDDSPAGKGLLSSSPGAHLEEEEQD